MVCGGVIWQDKGGNNVVLLLCQSQRRYCHAVKVPVIANIEDFVPFEISFSMASTRAG